MISFTVTLVIFASLAFVQAAEPNLNELKNSVIVNHHSLRQVTNNFQAAGYYTMGNQSEDALRTLRPKIHEIRHFPGDSQIEDLDLDHYRTYRDMLEFSIRFPLLSNATNLSDDLKSRALFTAVKKILRYDYTTPHPMRIIDTVLETIRQEEGVLIDGLLVKPSPSLEALYAELNKATTINSLTSTVLYAMTYWIHDHCMLPDSLCSYRLGLNVEKYFNLYKLSRLNVPIDSEEKVDNLLEIFSEGVKLYDDINEAIDHDKLRCLFSMDGCKKWSEV